MKNFCEMPFVKALFVVLLVIFVLGGITPSEVFARTEMQNGHEGDPTDGHDVVGGGGGGSSENGDEPEAGNRVSDYYINNCLKFYYVLEFGLVFQPSFDGYKLVSVAVVENVFWRKK